MATVAVTSQVSIFPPKHTRRVSAATSADSVASTGSAGGALDPAACTLAEQPELVTFVR